MMSETPVAVIEASTTRPKVIKARLNRIPDDILHDPDLAKAISVLPTNLNFEIYKSVWRIRHANAERIALQLPEGLTRFATALADIIEEFGHCECIIMADVTYGACCIDDFTASALGCDFLIHYGHSCLVPIDRTLSEIKMLYVFVDIAVDVDHLVDSIVQNISKDRDLVLVGTIQFSSSLHAVAKRLRAVDESGFKSVVIPQAHPLTAGELLGCTSPRVAKDSPETTTVIYLGDGRFHLESMMIANPLLRYIRYDPMSKRMTTESYDQHKMKMTRKRAIDQAVKARRWAIVLGTLGRQGSLAVFDSIRTRLDARQADGFSYSLILISEITPAKLALMTDVQAFVQIACPRLSIDWGSYFEVPLLTPYEAIVALGQTNWPTGPDYPMDYYSRDSLGPWTPNHVHGSSTCGSSCSQNCHSN